MPYFKKLPVTFSNHHSDQSTVININAKHSNSKKIMICQKVQTMVSIFSNKVFLIKA